MRTILLAILILLIAAGNGLAESHTDLIETDETWLPVDNPHIITDHLTVIAGVTLTLLPGVIVEINDNLRMDISGNLVAVGTPDQEILFTQSTPNLPWETLRFLNSSTGILEYCTLEYSQKGISAANSDTVTITHMTLQNNGYGIYATGETTLMVADCLIQTNDFGLLATNGTVKLRSTTFSGNEDFGVSCVGIVPFIEDENLVFTGNGTGFHVKDIAGVNLMNSMDISGSTTAGILLDNCPVSTVNNQILTNNTGTYGALFMANCGEFTLGPGNTIGEPGLENSWPLTLGTGSYPSADSVIPVADNTNNDIQIAGRASARTGTWRKFADLDYIITDNPSIQAGGELILEPGVELYFNPDRRLEVRGTLTAVGAPGQEILFTRNTTGNWNYVGFLSGGSGTLDHCIIEHSASGIYAEDSGTLAISNLTIRNNDYGLHATGGTVELASTTFSGNTSFGFHGQGVVPTLLDENVIFTDNATGFFVSEVAGLNLASTMTISGSTTAGIHLEDCDGPTIDNQILTGNTETHGALFLDDCGEFTLGAGNTIGGAGLENSWPLTIGAGSYPSADGVIPTTGNTNNDIQVWGGASGKSGSWRNFIDLDYVVVSSPTVSEGGQLILEPGVTLRFAPTRRLEIFGTLTALGSPGQEILFTKNEESNWNFVRFLANGSGAFDYCIIEHSSNGIYTYGSGNIEMSNLTLQDNTYAITSLGTGNLWVNGCLIQNNGHGLYATGGTLDLGATTFSGNTAFGLYGQGVFPNLLDENVAFSDNATSLFASDVADLNLTTTMNITGSTIAGIHLENCDQPTIDNQTLTGNTGAGGALILEDCGEFTLGEGNTIGGAELENSWPLSIGAGSYPGLGGLIPTAGNTNNDIQVVGGSSARTGTWRKFTDLDYIVTTGNPVIQEGGALTLEPGVNLQFFENLSLEIHGNLTAFGNPSQNIIFTKGPAGNWGGLRFVADGGGIIAYSTIEHSLEGINASGAGTIFLSHVTLQNNNIGTHNTGASTLTLSACEWQENDYGIMSPGSGGLTVVDGLFENNSYGVHAADGTIFFQTTRIINNLEYGVFLDGATPTFGNSLDDWNDIYGNGAGESGRDLRNGGFDIEARYVHWGTMDHAQILTQVWDRRDDDGSGYVQILPFINATHDGQYTDVDELSFESNVPVAFGLHQNAPNPFNPSTIIRFDLTQTAPVRLKVFDISGSLVTTLLDDQVSAGQHQVTWHGRDDQGRAVPSGVYFYRIAAGQDIATREMTLIK